MSTAEPALTPREDRYGRPPSPRRRRVALVAAAVAIGLGLAWVVWAGLGQASADVRFSDVGYRVIDDSKVEVTYDVGKDPGATAVCSLRALDRQKTAVGIAEVTIGPTEAKVTRRTDVISTAALAVTGFVRACSVRG